MWSFTYNNLFLFGYLKENCKLSQCVVIISRYKLLNLNLQIHIKWLFIQVYNNTLLRSHLPKFHISSKHSNCFHCEIPSHPISICDFMHTTNPMHLTSLNTLVFIFIFYYSTRNLSYNKKVFSHFPRSFKDIPISSIYGILKCIVGISCKNNIFWRLNLC